MDSKYLFSYFVIFVFSILNCEEKLPNRNEPDNVFEGVVKAESKRIAICASNFLPAHPLVLSIGTHNIFDETLQDTQYIKITLSIWPIIDPSMRRTLTFELFDPQEVITLDPSETYWVKVEWDHRDVDGDYVWKSLAFSPITEYGYEVKFRAVGTIQIFNKVPAVPTSEIEFSVVYYLNERC